MPARATCRPTPRGAGSCSLAASTRRRRSSRPGFRRSRTAPSISSARSRRLQPHSPACPSREPPDEPGRPSMSSGGLERLRELLSEQGGMIATLVAPASSNGAVRPAPPSPAALAAEGPRADGRREEYELLIEAIYEGYLLHYGAPRVLEVPEADLGLLAGDQLYAIGLARLGELADTITLSALAQGSGDFELAEAVWAAGARAVGWGPSEAHSHAKDLMLGGGAGALEAMRTSALGNAGAP